MATTKPNDSMFSEDEPKGSTKLQPPEPQAFRRAYDLVPPLNVEPPSVFAPPADAETQRRQRLQALLFDVVRGSDADRAIAETTAQTAWVRIEHTAEQLADHSLADLVRVLGLTSAMEILAAAHRYQAQIREILSKELEVEGISLGPDPIPSGFQKALEALQAGVAERFRLPGSPGGYGTR